MHRRQISFFGGASACCAVFDFDDDDPPEVAGCVTAFIVGEKPDLLSGCRPDFDPLFGFAGVIGVREI